MEKQNVIKSLYEGRVIKSSINKMDSILGTMFRYYISITTKIDPNKIVFMTYSNSYICNPKYIQQKIAEKGLPYDMVWICNKGAKNIEKNFPESVRVARRGTYEAYREIASAKIWIDNSINFLWEPVIKKRGQIYIETWHGSLGLKRAGKEDIKNPKWLKASEKCNPYTNYCISNSDFENFVYRDTHWSKTKILKLGHARNDILFNKNKEFCQKIKAKVYEYFSLEENDKILLYAPTFRDSGTTKVYDIDFKRLKETLEEKYGGTWKILLRHHFHNRKKKFTGGKEEEQENYLIDATKYIDMQELLCVTDIGISDYSSWLCDFVLTKRPAFIYAVDIDEYNTERGLYYPLETTPFPIATNNDELMNNILKFDAEEYEKKAEKFIREKGCIDDGNASERIVKVIQKLMK